MGGLISRMSVFTRTIGQSTFTRTQSDSMKCSSRSCYRCETHVSVDVESNFTGETATDFRRHRYAFREIDIVLLEGIFLFKPAYRKHFDIRIWIDCSFECALKRAVMRGQEGLPPAETRKAFETIYFPAQQIHLARDNPREAADYVFRNDHL